tara:strand:- start:594 stop:1700 length:1107 start_codon:yes stop_codon:yes gene_type:complete
MGGGGAPATTTGTTYSSNLPEYAKPYYQELLKQTGKEVYSTDADGYVSGVEGFTPYTGERLAGFTDQQKVLQGQVQGITPGAAGYTTGAANVGTGTDLGLGTATTGIGRVLDYDAAVIDDLAMADRAEFGAAAATKYMDPYQANVTDMLKEDARRDANIAKSGRAMGSIGRGTFGGGRQALVEGQADRDLQTILAKIGYQGDQDKYRFAADQFERDQARTLTADQANLQADMDARKMTQTGEQFEAELDKSVGLAGLEAGLTGGKTQAAIAGDQRMTELKTLLAQATDAEEVQRLNQEIDSLAYQEFKEAQDYEKNQLQYMSDILRGNAGALGSTNVQYAAAPSLASQIGGGIAGIAGLYGALGGGKG